MRRDAVPLLAACTLAACATATRAYVGDARPPDDGTPVLFAPGVISTGDVFASTFTPDGRTVVFTKVPANRPLTLMQSHWRDGRWTAPETLPFSGTYRDLDPAFSPDGSRLYFSSRRPTGPSPADTTSLDDTWYVDRLASGWSAPVRVAAPVNSEAVDMYPSVTRRGALYFDSSRSRRRMAYRADALPGGGWSEPVLLDVAINGDSGSSNLFVDPDERFVVFATRRADGHGGADLHVSWRTATGWSTAVNLGPTVNTAETEFCPYVSPDGRYLFFTRAVARPGAQPERNIHVVRFDAILRLVGQPSGTG
jgi:Tol biopolymer transport system component